MKTYINPNRADWAQIASRRISSDDAVESRVLQILAEVKSKGDVALRRLALQIDGFAPEQFEVSEAEFAEAENCVTEAMKQAIAQAADNIRKFHSAQKFEPIEVENGAGVKCIQRAVPIQRVGLYIPGGSAPLFSTVLMLAIPAVVAGCPHIVMCTPTGKTGKVAPEVLYAARMCGVQMVYKIGGAQAVAAMAYGTESVLKVDKIFGPGNRYVTKAKQHVSVSDVAIDMPAGPSEVLVVADESAEVSFAAADILSQAEHGPDSQAILVCSTTDFAERAEAEVQRQLALLPRAAIASQALDNSRIVVLESRDEQIEFINYYAPEHLIILCADAWSVANRITASGSVFVGAYSPESAGDYASGTNHTLPTSGWAKAYSGVNLDSYMRKITYQELTREGLSALATTIVTMAEGEGLDAHAAAVKVRLKGGQND
ncbi:MAG: histidinol dehydrogenase [Rikenellaceae bacterium]|nr:histidinol dehydrogenase [Rikenellaceae bacterium]